MHHQDETPITIPEQSIAQKLPPPLIPVAQPAQNSISADAFFASLNISKTSKNKASNSNASHTIEKNPVSNKISEPSSNIITVVRDPNHTLGKRFIREADGTISKQSSVSVSFGIAMMHQVDTHEEMAALLTRIGNDSNVAIINAAFNDINVGEEFIILSEREIEDRHGIPSANRQKQKGVHQIQYEGKPYKAVGRFKENVYPSSWQYLDRDIDQHTPEKYANLSFEDWVLATFALVSNDSNVTYIKTASTSSRVLFNGDAVGGGNGHAWFHVKCPDDIERFRTAMMIAAVQAEMTWYKPRYSRVEPKQVVGQSLTTIFDSSVLTLGRLVFVGQPVVNDELTVIALTAVVIPGVDGNVLDTSKLVLPDAKEIRNITRKAGVEMSVQKEGHGLRITANDLTLNTEIETKHDGIQTVRQLLMHGVTGKIRCQSPFRESSSYAAFYSVNDQGNSFVYDAGTGITHWLHPFEESKYEFVDGLTEVIGSADSKFSTKQNVRSEALEAMQKQFALIKISGKVWVIEGDGLNTHDNKGAIKKLELLNRGDGALLIHRALTAQFPSENNKVIECFMLHPLTICYSGVEFNPRETTANYLNLWVGPTVIAKPGGWELIQAFLLTGICNGNQECYDYLIRYIAHALQKPWEKPGVMIILIGGQGLGKGTLGQILRKIWRATYLQVNNIDNVTGNFNASLERAFIVFMDEALFSGDRKATNALKSLVTEPVIHINEKHQPSRQTDSYLRIFLATNADHVKNTERDDRRDFVLRVSEEHKGDKAYWDNVYHEIEHGGVEAMVHDLIAMDLSKFNVRYKPNTPELITQKLQSLNSIELWWHDCLYRGQICKDDGSFIAESEMGWPIFISTFTAIDGVMSVTGGKAYRRPTTNDIVDSIKKLCPSAVNKQIQSGKSRHRGLTLPPLEKARKEFEAYIGDSVPWPF